MLSMMPCIRKELDSTTLSRSRSGTERLVSTKHAGFATRSASAKRMRRNVRSRKRSTASRSSVPPRPSLRRPLPRVSASSTSSATPSPSTASTRSSTSCSSRTKTLPGSMRRRRTMISPRTSSLHFSSRSLSLSALSRQMCARTLSPGLL